MQYVQCFEFFPHFIFPVFQKSRNHSYIALGGKPIVRRKRMSVFSYSQRIVKLTQCTACFKYPTIIVYTSERYFLSKCKTTPTSSSVINHFHIDFHLSLTTRVFTVIFNIAVYREYLQASRTRSDIFLKVKHKNVNLLFSSF